MPAALLLRETKTASTASTLGASCTASLTLASDATSCGRSTSAATLALMLPIIPLSTSLPSETSSWPTPGPVSCTATTKPAGLVTASCA